MSDGSHILLSSERQDWRTPGWFLDLVRRVGPIELDPCTTPENPTGAARFYSQTIEWHPPLAAPRVVGPCGLTGSLERDGLAFWNPVYGPQLASSTSPKLPAIEPHRPIWRKRRVGGALVQELVGVGRGWAARIAQDEGESLVLVPVRSETRWWKLLRRWCDWLLLWGSPEYGPRISFVDPDTGLEKGGSNLASTVFYRGPRVARFMSVFGPHGELVPGTRTLDQLMGPRRRVAKPSAQQVDIFGRSVA